MRYAVSAPNMAPPARLVDLAVTAEEAGWDGFFLWDHLQFLRPLNQEIHDPWVVLGAVATRTSHVRIGTLVTPVPRRRPWVLAKQVVTLDHLSDGRTVLGVGLGEPAEDEYEAFGERGDARHRADLLDEGLTLLDAFLRGEPVAHDGAQHRVDAHLRPGSVQRPRPPIWVAAKSPARRPLRRGARWDGVVPIGPDGGPLGPEELADYVADLPTSTREPGMPAFELVANWAPGADPAGYAAVGADWLVDSTWPMGDWVDGFRAQIAEGPPR